jgi:16S rRNA (uracil1498-N3)-methyltransferase
MIRLFLRKDSLKESQIITINEGDFDYLIKVMRKKVGDEILIFNGASGEFLAKIYEINKKDCKTTLIKLTKEQNKSSNITLAFAPVKNVRIDFIAAKACELGVNKFQPIITHHSVVDKINEKRFLANTKEAAEQCERLDVPKLEPIVKLASYLKCLNKNQILILCDESQREIKTSEVLSRIDNRQDKEIIIFIGPEGGFSKKEFEIFYDIKEVNIISLGPRILRTDTAIISALALVGELLT